MSRKDVVALAFLVVALLFVGFPLFVEPSHALADPLSELPVRLWVHETFWRLGIFGARVDSAGFPNLGPLNNPDPLGTVLTAALRPLLGRAGAYDALVLGQVAADLLAAWIFARELLGDTRAGAFAAVSFALTPLLLVYGVTGAVVDVLALWPYPLCARSLVRALRTGNWKDAAAAGAWVGVGFVTCPYNILVFYALFVPAGIWLVIAGRAAISPTDAVPELPRRRLFTVLMVAGIAAAAVAGPYAVRMRSVMADPTSQMSDDAVAGTRHSWPYPLLQPTHTHRYVAYLSDYVAVGKGALIEREAAARFYRAFSPGITTLGLAAAGLLLSRRRRAAGLWIFVAGFAALASTGPYLPVTSLYSFPTPTNPAWGLLALLPGTNLLLEPFRYGLVVAFALGVAAAIGLFELGRRFGGWVAPLAITVWLAELVVLSPVSFPLPTAPLTVPAVHQRLDQLLPAGAVIELPYFDRGTDRFERMHFLHQLVHGRPIADEVLGFPARYLVENQFTAALLANEKRLGPLAVRVSDPARVEADRQRLGADGFAGFVVDAGGYANPDACARTLTLLKPYGVPQVVEGIRVYAIGATTR